MNFKIYMIGKKLHIDKVTDVEVGNIDIDIHNVLGMPRIKGITDFERNFVSWDSNKELTLRRVLNDSKNMREVIVTYVDEAGISMMESNVVNIP